MFKRRIIDIGRERIEIPDFGRNFLYYALLVMLAAAALFTAFYTIDTDQVGVVLRFGRYVHTTEPGLHLKLPWGIDAVKKVKVQRVFKEEFGFRTVQAGIRTEYATGNYSAESLMLTGDLNSALVEWIVQYRIKDPKAYLFQVRNVEATLRYVAESVMRQVVGDNSVDEVIILRRKDIALEVMQLMQGLLDEYKTGLDIVTVNLQDVNPPGPVQPAFNEVNEARQERERIINEAWESYNASIPRAKGEAEQLILEAEGYAANRVNRARGDAEKFLAIWREYQKAPDVTRRRLYLEMMQEVLPRIDQKYIIDEDLKSFLPLLQMGRKEASR